MGGLTVPIWVVYEDESIFRLACAPACRRAWIPSTKAGCVSESRFAGESFGSSLRSEWQTWWLDIKNSSDAIFLAHFREAPSRIMGIISKPKNLLDTGESRYDEVEEQLVSSIIKEPG